MFYRAGGIRFIADVIPYLSKRYDIDFYVAGAEDDEFSFLGATVHIVSSPHIPFTDKRYLPKLGIDADLFIFLDYTAALTPNGGNINLVIFHHLAHSFYNENPELYRKYFGRIGMRFLPVERLLLRRVLRKAPHALSVSNVPAPYLLAWGFNPRIVGNGIDVERYRPKEKEGYAVAVGRLVNYKRFEWAIALAERTGIPLKIIGSGPLESYLRRIAPPNVEFCGYVDEDEKRQILARARYLFAFSAFEGFDLPVIEAMASGAVPIMSDIRAHRFILSGTNAGVLVDSVDDAVAAVRRLERDDGVWERLSRSGRRLVETKWNAQRVAEEYMSVIDSLLGG